VEHQERNPHQPLPEALVASTDPLRLPTEQHPQPVPEVLDTTFSMSAIALKQDGRTSTAMMASQDSGLHNLLNFPNINEQD
jgi:hypothetical protein